MKNCNNKICKQINPQPLDNFFKDKNNKTDGHYSICKTCKTEKTLEWRSNNREKYNAGMRVQHKKNYVRNRLYRYNITPEQYNALLQYQTNLCAICDKPPQKSRPLVIDHDPNTDVVRGLLCYGCNRLMRLLDVNALFESATIYKETPPFELMLKGTHVTEGCLHPAVYPNGSEGWCKLCREKAFGRVAA